MECGCGVAGCHGDWLEKRGLVWPLRRERSSAGRLWTRAVEGGF